MTKSLTFFDCIRIEWCKNVYYNGGCIVKKKKIGMGDLSNSQNLSHSVQYDYIG